MAPIFNDSNDILREKFDTFVYTPFAEAIAELKRRRDDPDLVARVENYIGEIPKPLQKQECAVLFRQIATPQFEIKRFFDIATGFDLKPLFWEYHRDKFSSKNKSKHALGKLSLHAGIGKDGRHIVKKTSIIDFNTSNNCALKDIKTFSGESLVDFHHRIFCRMMPTAEKYLFDSSDWLEKMGGKADIYYEKYLALFLVHGILFENFMLDDSELSFTKEIFLPSFEKLITRFGIKPMIVALNPTEIEGDDFWYGYSSYIESVLE